MKTGIISLFTNETERSTGVENELKKKLTARGYEVVEGFHEDAELLICIGGDGAFLRTMHRCGIPETPIVGINTGHLGFFQEVWPEDFETFRGLPFRNKLFLTVNPDFRGEFVRLIPDRWHEGCAVDDIKSSFRVMNVNDVLNRMIRGNHD